ncbi:hypothetical protein COL154_013980 [Colletotrichum chrysophilum]|nr:hypothetical protein COL154_013980 [Colletotrichum chrysophilum]
MVAAGRLGSVIFWGPPGTGKTTVGRLVAKVTHLGFVQLSAIQSGVQDLRKVFDAAKARREHGKGTLLSKMAGDDWQKFATLRAFYAFMWGYPGKKLLFMGQEFAQRREWSEARSLDWDLLQHKPHSGMRQVVRDLNYLYRSRPALHARDCEPDGFAWLIVDDSENSVFAWLRKAPGENPVAVISNFTPVPRQGYRVPLPHAGTWREIINTDATDYGGSGMGNGGKVEARREGEEAAATLLLPPLSTIMLEFVTD